MTHRLALWTMMTLLSALEGCGSTDKPSLPPPPPPAAKAAPADLEMRLDYGGAQAILVGESLMRHGDIGAKVRELLET